MRVIGLALLLCGCHHVQMNATTGDSQHTVTVSPNPINDAVVPTECPAGLGTVRISGNYGYAWLSVITLGFVNLTTLEYSCAPQTGVVPAPVPDTQ